MDNKESALLKTLIVNAIRGGLEVLWISGYVETNDDAYGLQIAFIGNYDINPPTTDLEYALMQALSEAIEDGTLIEVGESIDKGYDVDAYKLAAADKEQP